MRGFYFFIHQDYKCSDSDVKSLATKRVLGDKDEAEDDVPAFRGNNDGIVCDNNDDTRNDNACNAHAHNNNVHGDDAQVARVARAEKAGDESAAAGVKVAEEAAAD